MRSPNLLKNCKLMGTDDAVSYCQHFKLTTQFSAEVRVS